MHLKHKGNMYSFWQVNRAVREKEFQHRLKKAAKVLLHGLHRKEISSSNNGTPDNSKKTSPKKIKAVKKAKSAPKETAV